MPRITTQIALCLPLSFAWLQDADRALLHHPLLHAASVWISGLPVLVNVRTFLQFLLLLVLRYH